MKIKNFFISFFIVLNSLSLFVVSNINGQSLAGEVHNFETEEPIESVVVLLEETSQYSTTNADGKFLIKKIKPGKYTILINHISYKDTRIEIDLTCDTIKTIIIHLKPKVLEMSQVLVTSEHSHSKFDEVVLSSVTLQGKRLERKLGLTLASTLKNEAGLAMRSMGPAPARPVIRGLSGDRILIAEDGKKTVDLSATSPDHAVTIDPFGLESIEVIRGPKVVLKTSTTMGGIVNAIRHDVPTSYHKETYITLGGYGESVNKGYLGSAQVEIPYSRFILKGNISKRKTGDLYTPSGTLKNSYSENLNYNTGLSYINNFGFIGASFKSFDLEYGVPGGFVGAHPNGVDISMNKTQFNFKYEINFKSKTFTQLLVDVSRAYYRHKEFEESGAIGADFRILEYFGHMDLDHTKLLLFDKGTISISSDYRDFNVGGFVFTSPSKSTNIALAIFETVNLKKLNLEFGARYNFDNIKPIEESLDAKIGHIRTRTFNTYSLSFSTLYSISDIVYVGANINKTSRVPTIEELYSAGPHLAAYSYEVGNPDLEAEGGIGTELFIYHKFDDLDFNLNLFFNFIDNFIIARNTGKINYQTLLPIYQTTGTNANMYGFEGRLKYKLNQIISIDATGGYTYGIFRGNKNPLPQIPPFKGLVGINYTRNDFNFSVSTEWAAKQNRVDEFEQPTAGYIVWNIGSQYSIHSQKLIHNFTLAFENIFNQEYRNHLSRVKSILPEAGSNVRLTYKLFFHY